MSSGSNAAKNVDSPSSPVCFHVITAGGRRLGIFSCKFYSAGTEKELERDFHYQKSNNNQM